MKLYENRDALQSMLAERMRALDASDLGNGTPFADAAATIAAHDMAMRGSKALKDKPALVAAEPEEHLRGVMQAVHEVLDAGHGRKAWLPSGLQINGSARVGVNIGMHHYVPVSSLPGLHVNLRAPDDPLGFNVDALRTLITEGIATLPPMDVAPPQAHEIEIGHVGGYRSYISLPLRGGPGVRTPHHTTHPRVERELRAGLEGIAAEVVEMARDAWERRDEFDAAYAATSAVIAAVMDKARTSGLAMRYMGAQSSDGHRPRCMPVFEILGRDLRPTRWQPWAGDTEGLAKALAGQLTVQRRRAKQLAASIAAGGRVRVEAVTLAALRASGQDVPAMLTKVHRTGQAAFKLGRLPNKHDGMRLAWRDGMVTSTFNFSENATWSYGVLILRNIALAASIIPSLPGKRIGDVVEHPFLAEAGTIRSVNAVNHQWLKLYVAGSSHAFDPTTGEMTEDHAQAA